MASNDNSLYLKRDQESVDIPRSGVGLNLASGTFIGMNSAGNAVVASANSGSAQVMALGFSLQGESVGTWTTTLTRRFDAVDNPFGVGMLNSGGNAWVVGTPVWLSGGSTGAVNYSQTPPTNVGDMIQQVGTVVKSDGTFRVHIGTPLVKVSGSGVPGVALHGWRGALLDGIIA